MDTKDVWEVLAQIPIGVLVAWVLVIITLIATIIAGIVRLYKVFTKVREVQDENEKYKAKIDGQEEKLDKILDDLNQIKKDLDEQKDVNFKQVRYNIVHTCDNAIAKGEISAGKLRSLEEMYEEYTDVFHGNQYVSTLMHKVRKDCKIVRPLDD